MSNFTGYRNTTFKASLVSPLGVPHYKGRTMRFENGRRLWQETSKIYRVSRGDALRDAQQMAHDAIVKNFNAA